MATFTLARTRDNVSNEGHTETSEPYVSFLLFATESSLQRETPLHCSSVSSLLRHLTQNETQDVPPGAAAKACARLVISFCREIDTEPAMP